MAAGRNRPVSANSATSTRSWKTFFKRRKVGPDECSDEREEWCKSIMVPIDKGRIIRVLQTFPRRLNTPSASEGNLLIHEEKLVFFIHGVGGSADVWGKQIAYFHARGYGTIAPDMLGHGGSSKPYDSNAYSFYSLANDMLKIFDIFKGKRNILVGHSYGASFATLIAAERATAVSKVVLISGGPPTSLKPERLSVFCLPLPIFSPIKPIVVKKFRAMAFHSRTKDHETSFTLPAYALKAVMQGQNWPEGDEEYHSDLLVPVLLLYGNDDKFVTLEEERWTEEVIYGSHLEIIEDAGHMVMIEKPEMVNQMILNFLNRDATTRSMVDLSQASPSVLVDHGDERPEKRSSSHVVSQFVNKELLHNEISGASRPPSRTASRLSRHGSEKKTKIGF